MGTQAGEQVVDNVLGLFDRYGTARYDEVVSQTEHALQCAARAEDDGAEPPLVAAALLHDLGHLLLADGRRHGGTVDRDLHHESVAGRWLRDHFPDAVVDPVVLHVRAKRYLCAVDGDYHDTLSSASVHSLELQGGPLDDGGVRGFERLSHWRDAVRLRRWDDLAKVPDADTAELGDYRDLLSELVKS